MKCKLGACRKRVGPTAPLQDRLLSAVEKILTMAKKTAGAPIDSGSAIGEKSAANSCARNGDHSDVKSTRANPSGPPTEPPSAPPSPTLSEPASEHLPRRPLVRIPRLHNLESEFVERQESAGTERSEIPSPKPSQPTVQKTPSCKRTDEDESQQEAQLRSSPDLPRDGADGAGQSHASTTRPDEVVVAAPMVLSSKPMYSSQQKTGSSVIQNRALNHQVSSTSQPSLINEAARFYALQETRMQWEMQHMQHMASLEKSLLEKKVLAEDMMTAMAKEMHEAKMRSEKTLFERKLAADTMQQKQEGQLSMAKLRSEESCRNMQQELHNIRMNTAKLIHEHAETKQQIMHLQLKRAQLELQLLLKQKNL